MNNKKLLYVFLGLIAILGLTQLFNSRKDRSFKSELVNVDTSKVTRLVLHPQSENHAEIILSKENGEWIAEKGRKSQNRTWFSILHTQRTGIYQSEINCHSIQSQVAGIRDLRQCRIQDRGLCRCDQISRFL